MKINCKQVFKNLKDQIINNSAVEEGKKKESLTLGMVLSEVVLAPHKDKNGFRPLKGYELAKKFYNGGIVEIDTADFVQLKELLEESETYVPMIIGQALEMLSETQK